jgi:hypothetical protein
MLTHTSHAKTVRPYHYYRCKRETAYGPDACPQKGIRVERVEPLVWDFVSGLLKDPERLRVGLSEMIEQERRQPPADVEKEREVWLQNIAEAEHKRSRYQEMAAEGLITFDELRTKLANLEETREAARRELAELQTREQRSEQIERDRDALLKDYAAMVPEALEDLTGEERLALYRVLGLRVVPTSEGYEATGFFRLTEPTRSTASAARGARATCSAGRASRPCPG